MKHSLWRVIRAGLIGGAAVAAPMQYASSMDYWDARRDNKHLDPGEEFVPTLILFPIGFALGAFIHLYDRLRK